MKHLIKYIYSLDLKINRDFIIIIGFKIFIFSYV